MDNKTERGDKLLIWPMEPMHLARSSLVLQALLCVDKHQDMSRDGSRAHLQKWSSANHKANGVLRAALLEF